jgi:hypothetical protein
MVNLKELDEMVMDHMEDIKREVFKLSEEMPNRCTSALYRMAAQIVLMDISYQPKRAADIGFVMAQQQVNSGNTSNQMYLN